jgi:hypothetical protein
MSAWAGAMSCLTSSLNGRHVTLEPKSPFVPWMMRGLALLDDVCENAIWSHRNSSYCVSLLFVLERKSVLLRQSTTLRDERAVLITAATVQVAVSAKSIAKREGCDRGQSTSCGSFVLLKPTRKGG